MVRFVSRVSRRAHVAGTWLMLLLVVAWPVAAPSVASAISQWDFVPSPAPAVGTAALYGVGVLSPSDAWAVGTQFATAQSGGIVYSATYTFTIHWDGSAWSVVPSPNPSVIPEQNHLVAIAAIASDDVWAVGSDNDDTGTGSGVSQTLSLHWDGFAWSVVPSPIIALAALTGGSAFYGVTALSSTEVWAVGTRATTAPEGDSAPLTARWNGSSWVTFDAPAVGNRINDLRAVAAVSSNDVWGVGDWKNIDTPFHILIEHWDGAAWSVTPVADPAVNAYLFGVSAVAADDVWAVGQRSDPALGDQPLIMHWNGSAWSMFPLPGFPGDFNRLNSILANAADDIWAAGASAQVAGGPSEALLLHWDGTSWSVVPAGVTDGGSEYFGGLGRDAQGTEWVVGSYLHSGAMSPLTERLSASGSGSDPLAVPDGPLAPLDGSVIRSLSVSPNPLAEAATVSMTLARATPVRVEVLDLNGRRVRLVGERDAAAGPSSFRWDARDDAAHAVAPGLYFVRVLAGGSMSTRRVVVRR